MNVRDHLRELEEEAVRNYCADNCIKAAVAMTHVEGDFNLSNVLRSANFFGFKEAIYVGGSKKWDKRGAVGTHHYTPLIYCPTEQDFWDYAILNDYVPIALENNILYPMSNLFEFEWPKNPLLIVGEEQAGLPESILKKCRSIVTIPAYGSVRSLNVGTAAGIAMGLIRAKLS